MKQTLKKLLGLQDSSVGTTNESGRKEWLEKVLSQLPNGNRILDAGAGEQQFKKFCTHLDYVSQDFAQYVPSELEVGLQMNKWDYGKLDIISDIATIPEPDKSFDAIMCTEVFEHIINPREAIAEFSRLLKRGGKLILTAPFCSLTHFAPYHFYTGFNKYFYETELLKHDLEILEITANGNYFEYVAQEVRRLPIISESYTTASITNPEKLAIKKVLRLLERLSGLNNKSEEILNYGYHIVAIKKH